MVQDHEFQFLIYYRYGSGSYIIIINNILLIHHVLSEVANLCKIYDKKEH